MDFEIVGRFDNPPRRTKHKLFLTWDNWDDFGYHTAFGVFYVDKNSKRHDLGGIRIGRNGFKEHERIYQVGYKSDYIGDEYFSLGSSDEYYEKINKLGAEIRTEIFSTLNDLAFNIELFRKVEDEDVVKQSLLRSITKETVTGQFHRMTKGGAKLTQYSFDFIQRDEDNNIEPLTLSFKVTPESFPPTNVHVLIGKNGVGKTRIMNNMINSLVNDQDEDKSGVFRFKKIKGESTSFANLISVSFSAFDRTATTKYNLSRDSDIKYSHIGIVETTEIENANDSSLKPKDHDKLAEEFCESLFICRSRLLTNRWLDAVTNLQSDKYFEDFKIREWIRMDDRSKIQNLFSQLSSGHKVVLLIITRLIQELQERSLVLMDEPEAHLHPPLISAFIRTVSELLMTTNGVAIMATHSPVILQEVPRSCAWKLRREGNLMVGDRLERESFGENVGILTNDVFGLEVSESGFYKMILEVIEKKGYGYDEVIEEFGGQLGLEARSIIMSKLSQRKK